MASDLSRKVQLARRALRRAEEACEEARRNYNNAQHAVIEAARELQQAEEDRRTAEVSDGR